MWAKTDFPLIEFAAIEAQSLGVAGPGPDVLAVAADVHREHIDGVDADSGQIVHCPDQIAALAAAPGRIAGAKVESVRAIAMRRFGVVELVVGQQVLRAVGPALEEPALACRQTASTAGRRSGAFPGRENRGPVLSLAAIASSPLAPSKAAGVAGRGIFGGGHVVPVRNEAVQVQRPAAGGAKCTRQQSPPVAPVSAA